MMNEDFTFAIKTVRFDEHYRPADGTRITTNFANLARGVAPRLQAAALPELTAVAADLQMTAFIAVRDRRHCVTLVAVEPPHGEGTLVQRPGSRHRSL